MLCKPLEGKVIITKRTIIGVSLLISATIADIGILISASILGAGLTEWNQGKMWTALLQNGLLLPFILTKVVWFVAIILLIVEYCNKNEK